MEAVQKDHWYFMVLFIILSLLKVSAQQRGTVATVRLEEGMVLACLCPWDGSLSMVSWTKVPDKALVAVYHPEYGVSVFHPYLERIAFPRTTAMDGSITVSNVTQEDTGLYRCSVQTFPNGSWTRDILVEDAEVTEEMDVQVTVPEPEVITADAELVAEKGDNLTISCDHEHNGTVYKVVLERLVRGHGRGGGGVDILAVCSVVDGGLLGEDYTQSGWVSCSDSLEVSLHLTDVVEEDRGLYRCRFSTDAGLRTTTVLLTVPSPGTAGEFSLSAYLIYICVGGGVAGLALLSVVLALVGWHRKKKRREEYRVKLHPAYRRKWRQWQRE